MNNKFKIDLLSFLLFVALFIIITVSFVPVFLGQKKQTTTTLAQEGWKCPGANCDRCGCSGFWGAQCGDFCSKNPGGGQCGCINPNATPTVIIPSPTSFQTSLTPTKPTIPSPTFDPLPNSSLETTTQPTPTPCVSSTSLPNSSNSTALLIALLQILMGRTSSNTPCTSPSTPQVSITPTTKLPIPTVSVNINLLSSILDWTININNELEGEDIIWPPYDYYNRLLNPPTNGVYSSFYSPATNLSNLYWCTYLVINAYNLAGKTGLTAAQVATKSMQQFFMTTSGYSYIDYSVKFDNYSSNPPIFHVTSLEERKNALSQVKPGCAAFFQTTPGVHVSNGNHTAVLKTIDVDGNYNGSIETYDANNTRKIVRYPVYGGTIQGTPFTSDSLRGFGCPSL